MNRKQLTAAIGIMLLLLLLCVSFACAEQKTVIDNESVAITINGFEENLLSFGMKVTVENKTDDTIIFSLKNVIVNGDDDSPLWAVEVPPNTVKSSAVNWYSFDNSENTDATFYISGTFRAYLKDNWNSPDIATADFVYYPYGTEKLIIQNSENAARDKVTVVDDDRFMITVNGYNNSSILYCCGFSVSLANRTDKTLMYAVRNVTVNGISCDPYWASELQPDTEKDDIIGWFASSFEACGIEKVETVEATFIVYEAGQFNPDLLFTKTITLNA